MKIAILDDYQNVVRKLKCFDLLTGHDVMILNSSEKNPVELAKMIEDVNVLVLIRERTEITEKLLSLLPNLKLISQTGKISNHLSLAACTKYKVVVAEGIGSPIAPAELTWALIMNAVRKIPQAIQDMKNGKWQTNIGSTVFGKTIGIWGYGKIGQKIANYAKAFGAKVLVLGSEKSMEKAVDDGFNLAIDKKDFFSTANVITLHLRLNDKTFGIVKESDLQSMKDNAVLINTARAELIEKGALLKVLKRERPIFAALDVFEDEPIYNRDFELLNLPNVICTPHLGYVEENSYELYFEKAFENIVSFINGNAVNIANPEVL